MNESISWNEYFIELAKLSAKRSKDPKTKVGAVIIDPTNNHILSIGYNGLPFGMEDSEEIWSSDIKHKYVVHAEANAILNSNCNLNGTYLYITMFPCNECAKLIAQKGIKKVFYLDDKFKNKETGIFTMKIFEKAGISIEKI